MEYKRQLSGRWFQKMVIFLAFSLFAAKAQAQIGLFPPPVMSVQPVGTNVQNGDSATFTASAYCTLGVINSVTWLYNGKSVPTTNTTVAIGGGGLLTTTINTSLTVNRATSGSAGKYSVEIASLLCGTTTSSSAALVVLTNTVPIVVSATPSASGMLTNGFKVQFSAPAGSNVVIQASSDLNRWTSICTNVAVGGSVTYTDAVAKTSSCRFYRGVLK